MLNFVRVAVQSHKVNLVSMDRNVGDDVLLYELPVDSKLQEFTISISGENPHISILDPQGRLDYLYSITAERHTGTVSHEWHSVIQRESRSKSDH